MSQLRAWIDPEIDASERERYPRPKQLRDFFALQAGLSLEEIRALPQQDVEDYGLVWRLWDMQKRSEQYRFLAQAMGVRLTR